MFRPCESNPDPESMEEDSRTVDQQLLEPQQLSGMDYNPFLLAKIAAIQKNLSRLIEEIDLQSPKRDLVKRNEEIDTEIHKNNLLLANLRNQEKELLNYVSQPSSDDDQEVQLLHKNKYDAMVHKALTENKRTADSMHQSLHHLNPNKVIMPFIKRPSLGCVYYESKTKCPLFKKRLIKYLSAEKTQEAIEKKLINIAYEKQLNNWLNRVKKIENQRKSINRKYQEVFEKEFPEIREKRTEQGSCQTRIRTRNEFKKYKVNYQKEKEDMETMLLKAAVIPPLLNAQQRRYIDTNGRIEIEPPDIRRVLTLWTDKEVDIFNEKYLKYPKQFYTIASYLEKKSVMDCVKYYYLTKKQVNYKLRLQASKQRTRKNHNSQGKENNPNKGKFDVQNGSKVPIVLIEVIPVHVN